MMISRYAYNQLKSIERDLYSLDIPNPTLCKDRQDMHEILNSIDPEPKPIVDTLDLIIRFEAGELDNDDTVLLFQTLITNGTVWKLQGCYGRFAQELIDAGYCTR